MRNIVQIVTALVLLAFPLLANEKEIEEQILNPPASFTENDLHQYLGFGAVATGILAGTLYRPNSGTDYETHEKMANLATALAVGAVGTGLYSHLDDLNVDFGWRDPDNQHIFLGGLGALLMAYSIAEAPDGGHADAGMAGVGLMAISIKLTW